jgi:uncharacterized protein (DUF2384 family)
MRFRPAGPKLAPDAAKRQGQVASFAFLTLGGRDAAMAFLNSPNDELGGRPIDVAVATSEGAEKVLRALRRLGECSAAGQ